MNRVKLRNMTALLLDLTMAALAAAAVGSFFTEKGLQSEFGNMSAGGVYCFRFFTIDSNLLAALGALTLIPVRVRALISGRDAVPAPLLILKFTGTAAVAVTFLVVLFFLGPTIGYPRMFEGSHLALHLFCPLIAICTFVFLDRGLCFSARQALWGLLPVLIYGAVYFSNVLLLKTWTDFYSFNRGGRWYISCAAMTLAGYLICLLLCSLHNRAERKGIH